MYIPVSFQAADRNIAFDLIEQIRLGTLISHHGGIEASLIPFMVHRDVAPLGRLVGHCARANPQWKVFERSPDVLVTFVSPHTYVSPSWYGTAPRAPTWLYATVHIRGRLTLVMDDAGRREIVTAVCDELEPASTGWSVHAIDDYVDRLLPGIVGFHIEIADIQTQLRLAQQNNPDDRRRVLAALERGDLSEQLVARLVRRFTTPDDPPPAPAQPQLTMKGEKSAMPGPYVFRNMTRPVLDVQYNIRGQIPDHPQISEVWKEKSSAARERLKHRARIDLAYGSEPLQKLDLFCCDQPQRPLLVFIHGGYWRAQDKSEFSYVAESFLADGVNVAVVNYRLAPHVTMDDIVSDLRESIAWLARNSDTLGFDRDRIYISGSSAGGHLTVMSLITDWSAYGLPRDLIKGGLALSGVYELEPIRLCFLNDDVRLDEGMVARNSPRNILPDSAPPLLVSVGGIESAEFHRQQRDFVEAWRARGLACDVIPQEDGHHFDMIDRMIDRSGSLYAALKKMMNIWRRTA